MDNLWGLKLLVDHEKFNGNVPPRQSFYDVNQTLKFEKILSSDNNCTVYFQFDIINSLNNS